jgi:NAD(P)-dependent dehydrogenase (short-subunit alcohol dehydrogenase family)
MIGLIGFTRALALDTAGQGIRANTVSPAVVMTEMGKTVSAGEKGQSFLEAIPVQRFAEVEDVAAAVLFLCSDDAALITGTELLIDGGNTVR